MLNPVWTITVHPDFLKAFYRIPRGVAADISDVIAMIAKDPTRMGAPIEGQPGRYRTRLIDHLLFYEVVTERRIVRMLALETIPKP